MAWHDDVICRLDARGRSSVGIAGMPAAPVVVQLSQRRAIVGMRNGGHVEDMLDGSVKKADQRATRQHCPGSELAARGTMVPSLVDVVQLMDLPVSPDKEDVLAFFPGVP